MSKRKQVEEEVDEENEENEEDDSGQTTAIIPEGFVCYVCTCLIFVCLLLPLLRYCFFV